MKKLFLWLLAPLDGWLFDYLLAIGGTYAWFQGLRGSGDWGSNERPTNFREMILWRNPNGSAPLTALLSKTASRRVNDAQFSWWEEELAPITLTLASQATTTSITSFVFSSGANALVPGDILLLDPTGATSATGDTATYELAQVVAITSDTNITVSRSFAGTTAASLITGVTITRIGNAFAEGTTSPSVATNNPTLFTNYCQIFKTAYDITNTAKLTYARTGDPLKNDKKRKMFHHSVSLEYAFLFGIPSQTTGSNGKPIRSTGGMRQAISSNVTVFSTTPTSTTFINAIQPMFNYDGGGGNQRLALCGNGFLTALNKLAAGAVQIRVDEVVKLYGMNLQRWIIPQGEIYLRSHPLMNVHPRYQNSCFFIDPSSLVYTYLRDTHLEDNIQVPDGDDQKGQWLTEAGLEWHHEKTMAYIGNFTVP